MRRPTMVNVVLSVFCNAGRAVWESPFSRGYFGVYVALVDSVFIGITEFSVSGLWMARPRCCHSDVSTCVWVVIPCVLARCLCDNC